MQHNLAYEAASQHLPGRVRRCMAKAKALFDVSDYKLQFMLDCARELRLCRLALKWSYPYIYCMKEVETHQYQVLEMKQAKLEKYTDLLHEAMADVEVCSRRLCVCVRACVYVCVRACSVCVCVRVAHR